MRDGANLEVLGDDGQPIFAPSFSIWTTIEECLNPPVIWEKDREGGWFTTPPFSGPEVFDFPEGIGPVECVNVEHEEVLLMPRWVDAKRVTFGSDSGRSSSGCSGPCTRSAWTGPTRSRSEAWPCRRATSWRPACPTRPASGHDARQDLRRPAGHRHRKDGEPRSTYLFHVVDNEWSMREYGHQCVVWQTAINPVVALGLLSRGTWAGAGCWGRRRSTRCRSSTC